VNAVTEREWMASPDLHLMLEHLGGRAGRRQLCLFACACCRRIWHLLVDQRSRRAVAVAECLADGGLPGKDVAEAWVAAGDTAHDFIPQGSGPWVFGRGAAWYHAAQAAAFAIQGRAWAASTEAAKAVRAERFASRGHSGDSVDAERCLQAALLRDIVGNPFAVPPRIDPAWLRWNDGTVFRLARAIYDERRFKDMGVLHDALLDAGCGEQGMLDHCKEPIHVRGCWVLDLLLNKE
jgi:hypothetical protein